MLLVCLGSSSGRSLDCSIIKEQYGASTLSQCRKREKTELKYARYTNHLRYSLRCLHNNLILNDLYLKPKLQDAKSRKILDKASRLLLQNRIHENHYIRKNLNSSIKQTTDNLSDTLTREDQIDLVIVLFSR